MLAAVDEPAAVCDTTGRVLTGTAPSPSAPTASRSRRGVVRRPRRLRERPAGARAVETGEETIGRGPLAPTGREVTVAVRPVERDGSVSAVVATVSEPTDPFEDDRALYEASADAAADSVYVVDPSYRIRVASEGFTRFTGVPTDAVEGRDVACLRELGIVDEEAFHAGIRALRALFAGESDDECVTADVALEDGPGVVENRMRPIERDGEVVGVVNAVRDVTERERRREALATNRERLATVLDDLPVLLIAVDEDGRIDHCQGMDFDAFDCERTDLLDEPIEGFESVCPDVVAGFRRALDGETASATETVNDRTYTVCIEPVSGARNGAVGESASASGVAESADAQGGAIAVAMDVTDRTRREAALHTREQELRAVIDSSADPIAMQDLDGRFQVVNEAMLAAMETDRERVIGSRHEDLFPDAFGQRVEAHRRAVLETERARVVEETLAAGDEEVVIQLTLAPYHGPDCEVQGTVSIARDITELERQRDELETLTEIQELVQESMRALTGATTSEAIQETVCDRLAESEFYEFAWIGQRQPGERELQPVYSAGDGGDYLDSVTVNVDAGERGTGRRARPTARARSRSSTTFGPTRTSSPGARPPSRTASSRSPPSR
ncbi:PAS domain-containing protein [Halosimplex aquaticum]